MGTKKERTKLLLAFILFSFLILPFVFFGLSFCTNKTGKGGNNNNQNNNNSITQNNIPIPHPNGIMSPDSVIKEVKVEVSSSRLVILRWELGKLGALNMKKTSLQEKEKMSPQEQVLFEISRADDKGDEKILGQTNQTSFVDSPEKAGKYCWKVKAKKSKEENEVCSFDDLEVKEVCSEIKDVGEKEKEPPPHSPSNLKAQRQGDKVILSWERKGGELGFKVQRCIKKENSDCRSDGFYVVGITEDTIFEDEILCVGSNEACWRVVSYNKGGESGYSNKVCLKLDCIYVLVYKDEDQDGYGSDELKMCVKEGQMPAGVTIVKGDCDDLDPKRNPSSAEVCDGKDNDCDLDIDEVCECKIGQERSCYSGPSGTEGVGVCKAGIQRCEGGVWGKCKGQVLPTAEICDGLDNDCDGKVDEADFSIKFIERLPIIWVSPYSAWSESLSLIYIFKECAETNPDYPHGVSIVNKSSSLPDCSSYTVRVTYYVVNSYEEWEELCKNYKGFEGAIKFFDFDITKYVDFSTQTVLLFIFSTEPMECSGLAGFDFVSCGADLFFDSIGILKGMNDGIIYIGWHEKFDDRDWKCVMAEYLPIAPYSFIITDRKISSESSFVIRYTSEDFCPYMP